MRTMFLLLVLALLQGCGGSAVSGDPVAPPPPPRLTAAANLSSDLLEAEGKVRQAKAEGPKARARRAFANQPARHPTVVLGNIDPTEETLASEVVGKVDGQVIFARECLDAVRPQFEQAREQLPAEAFEKLRTELIRRELPKVIERKILAAEARRHLAEPQMKQLRQVAERDFLKKLRGVLQEGPRASESELAEKLREQGLSFEQLRARHEEEFLARQYARAKISDRSNLSRRELMSNYEAHKDEYARPARVKWQHLEVSASASRDRKAARRKADELSALLDEGADFGMLARWKSDGPTAAQGGLWDWTTRGSIAARRVDAFLFQGEVGSVSPVLEGPDGFHLVKVLVREPARFVPFSEVQDEIRDRLEREKRAAATEKLLVDLYANAHVETIFDDDPAFLAGLPNAASRAQPKR